MNVQDLLALPMGAVVHDVIANEYWRKGLRASWHRVDERARRLSEATVSSRQLAFSAPNRLTQHEITEQIELLSER